MLQRIQKHILVTCLYSRFVMFSKRIGILDDSMISVKAAFWFDRAGIVVEVQVFSVFYANEDKKVCTHERKIRSNALLKPLFL
mmetsp:Transcript_13491/g.27938  ORF Transcript_13491/g.27938 Transcript_13491/m.27938 type:complete len:83 (+) Transcript_13491:296-544(+)